MRPYNKTNYVNVNNSVAFSPFTMLCPHHVYMTPILIIPKCTLLHSAEMVQLFDQ